MALFRGKLTTDHVSPAVRYLAAVGIFLASLVLRFGLMPIEAGYPYVTFYPAVVLAFYLLGVGPGIAVTSAAAMAAWYLLTPPYWSFHVEAYGATAAILFLTSCGLIGALARETRRATRESQAAEQRYLGFLEDQSSLISRLDANGTFIYANGAFCRFFGLDQKKLIGNAWRPLSSHSDATRVARELSTLTPANPVLVIENRVIAGDGSERWCQFENRAFFSSSGSLEQIQSVGFDITERKQLIKDLQDARDEVESLYNSAPCGYHSIDASGVIVRINDTELQWLGRERSDVIGRSISDFFTEESRVAFEANMPRFRATGYAKDLEFDLLDAKGGVRRILVSGDALRDSEGKFFMSRSVAFDITERKQKERESLAAKVLIESENRLTRFIEMVPASLAMFDVNMCYVAVSKGWIVDYGLEGTELIGRSHYEVFPEITDAWKHIHRRALAGETVTAAEDPFIRADGSTQWLKWEASPWQMTDGSIGGIVILTEDITERKRATGLMWNQANFDTLTQLPNRRLFLDRLERELALCKRNDSSLGVGFIDLDHFKVVNDTFGHEAGDAILIETAKRIHSCVRECDSVARYAGDEFMIVFGQPATQPGIDSIARRILASLELPYELGHGRVTRMSASIGIALFPSDATDSTDLIQCADEAMYEVKKRGRNGFAYYRGAPKTDVTP